MSVTFNPDGTATIDIELYNELIEAQYFLEALHDAGVDNWDGYQYARETMEDQDQ